MPIINKMQKEPGGDRLKTNRTSLLSVLFALWLVFIILSQVPFIAENLIDTSEMDETVESHLRFLSDGKTGHYYVERYDTNQTGLINVLYTTESNSLEVDCTNIKVLEIYCREMYEKKSESVFKMDPKLDSNYYKTYFIERNYFNVHVFTKQMITQLSFIDTPIPYNVTVNGREWWLSGINYTYNNDGIVLTKVPPGHSYVDIYFKTNDLNAPVAQFTVSKKIIGVGENITFNASSSYDSDGEITSYNWDLGDGSYKMGVTTKHGFSEEGNYKVILTVKDDDYLISRAFQEIIVVLRVMAVSISVDKLIATPGSNMIYTITPTINSTWQEGVKDIVITDVLPDGLNYVDSIPKPQLTGNTLIWKFNSASKTSDLTPIILQTVIDKNAANNTIISNSAMVEYKGLDGHEFPQELSNLVNTKVNTGSILAPRIIMTVPNVELQEDAPPFGLYLTPFEYDFHDSGVDLKWYITGENESLFILSGEYSDEDILTITPLPNAYDNNLVTLWLIDSEGYTANQPLWINITPVNDKPIFSNAPDLIIHYDDPYTFDYETYISDIDTPKEELIVFAKENTRNDTDTGSIEGLNSEDEAGKRIFINGLKVTYNYPESFVNKEVFVSLIVFDGNSSDGDTIQINVTDDYTPMLREELPDVWLEEGETKVNVFDLDEYFEDPDRDSLFYSFGETHVTVEIHKDHSVDISAPSDWNGIDIITFRARDPIGAIAEDSIYVTVIPINDPPNIEGVPDTFIVHYDADYSFDLTPYISDEDNELFELFLILTDEHIRTDPLKPLKIIMNYPQALVGSEIPVLLTVSDGLDTDFQEVTVKVTEFWPPEINKELLDVSFYEDEALINAFNLNDYFSDKDSNTLYYSYGQKNVNITINLNGSVDFSAIQDWFGVEMVTFRATDQMFAFVESIITVTVIPVNDPPVIQQLPGQKGIVNQLWNFDLTDFIFDIDNEVTELEISVESKEINIIVNGRELVIYSGVPVKEYITVIINDGKAETSETMLIEITEEKTKPSGEVGFLLSILWLLVLLIIIVISIFSYAAYRRYVGNFLIEQLFWINNDGILIFHLKSTFVSKKLKGKSKKRKVRADSDILSGMLTAILDFTEEAFSDEGIDKKAYGVKEFKMGEKNLLVERGKYTLYATIFTGRPGKKLYLNSNRTLQTLEKKFGKKLRHWDGGLDKLIGAKRIMRSMLLKHQTNNSATKRDK